MKMSKYKKSIFGLFFSREAEEEEEGERSLYIYNYGLTGYVVCDDGKMGYYNRQPIATTTTSPRSIV